MIIVPAFRRYLFVPTGCFSETTSSLEAKHIAVTFGVSHGASPSATNRKHSLILSHTGKSASSLNVYVSSSNGSFGERGDFDKLLFLNKEDREVEFVAFAPRTPVSYTHLTLPTKAEV